MQLERRTSGLLFFVTFTDIFLGYFIMLAFVMGTSVPVQSEYVLGKIVGVEGVVEAYRTFGVYDIVAVVNAETIEELKGTVTHIRTVKHVVSTLTLMVVK